MSQGVLFAIIEVPLPSYLVFREHKIRGLQEKTLYLQGPKVSPFFFSFLVESSLMNAIL
jgi:hypothetical protein